MRLAHLLPAHAAILQAGLLACQWLNEELGGLELNLLIPGWCLVLETKQKKALLIKKKGSIVWVVMGVATSNNGTRTLQHFIELNWPLPGCAMCHPQLMGVATNPMLLHWCKYTSMLNGLNWPLPGCPMPHPQVMDVAISNGAFAINQSSVFNDEGQWRTPTRKKLDPDAQDTLSGGSLSPFPTWLRV